MQRRSLGEGCGLALFQLHRLVRCGIFNLEGGMMSLVDWRWRDAKGGIRFAFPPYGP
jgi:hypothetical protein